MRLDEAVLLLKGNRAGPEGHSNCSCYFWTLQPLLTALHFPLRAVVTGGRLCAHTWVWFAKAGRCPELHPLSNYPVFKKNKTGPLPPRAALVV